jgi:serine/threonine protein kinase
MGEIFLAKHGLVGFEKLAVIKKILPHLAADEQFISRFVDEAQVAIKLSHVNVAQVFEVGRVGDEYFLALEYVDGRDLRRTLALLGHRRQRLPADLALFIARELANGLAYAHRRTTSAGAALNLVHCDISPPNVLVSFEGETKVIDFGIARSAMRATATDPKIGFGKFGYMAPEQLIQGGLIDHRTDLYAAGAVLYELLTGTRLYEAGPAPDYRALARKVTRGEHPLPSEIDPVLAPYDGLVATALRPKPRDRYQSAAELRDAIQHCLVAVNPTISTDQLGAYMRELFADEMTAQRELHDRVASAHLSDFHEQFHTQTISTISFALAQLPLQPSPAFDTMAPPTAALELVSVTDEPGPSDPFIEMAEEIAAQPGESGRRRRWLVISASAAIVLLAVFGLRGFGTNDGGTRATPPRGIPVTDPRASSVEQLPVEPGTEPADPDEIEMAPDQPAPGDGAANDVATAVTQPNHHVRHDPSHKPVHKDSAPTAPTAPFTREHLVQKFQQVRREYDDYKPKFGLRLEKEWGELATYIQYQYLAATDEKAGRKEAARRLDAFRGRMQE